MEGNQSLSNQTTGVAQGPPERAPMTLDDASGQGQASYTPVFGAPTTGPQANSPIQANLGAIQESLRAGLAPPTTTALPQLAGLTRKRARTETPSQLTAAHIEDVTGTPRSTRIRNLLPNEGEDEHKLGSILEKLLSVAMASIQFGNKGRAPKKIPMDAESAADILVLIGAAFDQHQLDQSRKVLFQPGRRQVTNQATASANAVTQQTLAAGVFNFQSAELNVKLDALAEQVAALTTAIQKPNAPPQHASSPSYALAASKHAPKSAQAALREPETRPRKPTARPATHKLPSTITLTQKDPNQPVFSDQATPRLLVALNSHLADKKIKLNENSKTLIEIKSIQRHVSNDMVLYLESQAISDALRKQVNDWLPTFSGQLTIKPDTHAVLVHGIPTTFNPQNPEHLEDLIASNGDRLSSITAVRWMNPKVVEEEQKRYSSIIILLSDRDTALRCVRDQVWYRFNKKRTGLGRRPPTRCYNCLKTGHAAASCPIAPLCPYCGDKHHAHTCNSKGKTPPKCTSCAREKMKHDAHVNIKGIFAANPTDMLHSPFDPKCAVRQAPTQIEESTHSIRIATRSDEIEMMTNV